MPVSLVNGIYPIDYFDLNGVNTVAYTDQFWWASRQRFAAYDLTSVSEYLAAADGGMPSSEFLVIDLGRLRRINYLTFDIMQMPIDVTVEYDAVSSDDGNHTWVPVTPEPEALFEDKIFYKAADRNIWSHPQFFFGAADSDAINSRFLRLRFARRDEAWPTSSSTPFRWSVIVKGLRVARQISDHHDLDGSLFDITPPSDPVEITLPSNGPDKTLQIRQQFQLTPEQLRGDITPKITGVSFLAQVDEAPDFSEVNPDPVWEWEVVDITSEANPETLQRGSTTGSENRGTAWVDARFGSPIKATTSQKLEFRARATNAQISNSVYTTLLNNTPGLQLPGDWTFTVNNTSVTVANSSVDELAAALQAGDVIQTSKPEFGSYVVASVAYPTVTLETAFGGATSPSPEAAFEVFPLSQYDTASKSYEVDTGHTLIMRLWGDIFETGEDLLGNQYRYGVRYQEPEHVFDTSTVGWMSAPQPSPLAVESMYFDVREELDGDAFKPAVLDAIRVAPRTPGVRMQVYISREGLKGRSPVNNDEWEKMYWEPVGEPHDVRGNKIYELERQVECNYIKLEFSNLRPLPFEVPSNPPMPPQVYRRHPTWVEQQFEVTSVRAVVDRWYDTISKERKIDLLDHITDPVKEFEAKQRAFFSELALGNLDSQYRTEEIDPEQRTFIDPITATKINFTANRFTGSLVGFMDPSSVLGKISIKRLNTALRERTIEQIREFRRRSIPVVSTASGRVEESFAFLSQTPMWFNRPARHVYKEELASFEGEAFFVGIGEVEFLRSDYTVLRDDRMIEDLLADTTMLDSMTFEEDTTTGIAEGQSVWVTYWVGPNKYEEQVTLGDLTPVPLSGVGGAAVNIQVFSEEKQQGTQYFLIDDYDMSYSTDSAGRTVNMIARSPNSERWTVPRPDPTKGDPALIYNDAAVVTGRATIKSWDNTDAWVVEGFGSVSIAELHTTATGETIYTDDVLAVGVGVGIDATGTYDELLQQYVDYDALLADNTTYDDLLD